MQKTTKRKGVTVWGLMNIATVFILLGVSIGLGVWINDELITTTYETTTVTNESVNFAVNNTWYSLAYRAQAVTAISNQTFGLDFDDTQVQYATQDVDYTTQIKVYLNVSGLEKATTYNVTYTSYQSDPHYVTQNSTNALSNLASWLPIIAIIIAAGVVIATLMVWFTRR